MASNEPPGGAPGNGPQEYAQPQDPWEGGLEFPPGQSSMPTDPIPHQYDPYSGTYPPYTSGTWVQQPGVPGPHTMPPSGWVQPPPPRPNRTVPLVIGLVVILMLAGGGAVAWYLSTHKAHTPGVNTTTAAPTSGAPVTSAAPVTTAPPTDGPFDPYSVEPGNCVANGGTNKAPRMSVVECKPGAYKVLKIFVGDAVKQDDDDDLTDVEAKNTCKGTGYTFYYKNNFDGIDNDIVFCMTKAS